MQPIVVIKFAFHSNNITLSLKKVSVSWIWSGSKMSGQKKNILDIGQKYLKSLQ